MLLAIDAGNSTINVGLFGEEKKLLFLASLETDRRKTRDQFCVDLMNLFALYHYELQDVQGAILCSVVPALDAVLEGALTRLLGRRPVVVGPGAVTGLPMRVTLEYQVGADIIADAVGALEKFRPPIIVIDMGTATTISAVDAQGRFAGGAIVPGLRLSMESLSGNTSQLPRVSLDAPAKCIGTNTVACMQSGAIYGSAALLDGMIERMETELGAPAAVIATGGLAGCVTPFCRREIRYEPDLLLIGLAVLWEKNRSGKKA